MAILPPFDSSDCTSPTFDDSSDCTSPTFDDSLVAPLLLLLYDCGSFVWMVISLIG